ncbi:MAG TPA: L,D-transpeptidase family protein [Longimicrobiaceae bacterium]|nr:L,D-transpeptidase family protein [Longimicrobiaceae bacterium]
MQQKLWTLVLGLGVLAVPAAAQPPNATAPRDTGLILGSLEAAIARPVEAVEDFSLLVDLSDRRLYVLSGDEVVRTYPVAVGLESYPTPPGDYRIRRMEWNPSWRPPPSEWARDETPKGPGEPGNPMGRVKIFFREPDYYIHGTGLTSSLGNARSHGCIRMRNIDAVDLARVVMIHGGSDRPAAWYEQTLEQKGTTRTVALERPIPVKVRR